MTCVVAVPVREGLIVAADRMSTGNDGRLMNETPKLVPLRRGVLTVSGKTGIGTDAEASDLFDARAIAFRELSSKRLDTVDWSRICLAIGEPLKDAIERLPVVSRPPRSTLTSSVLQVMTFFVDSGGALRLAMISAKLQQIEPVVLGINYQIAGPSNFTTARPLVWASNEVWTEIQKGTDRRFDDLRADSVYRRFVTPPAGADVTADEGATFARQLIDHTGERKHLLGGARNVSRDCSVALLGLDGSVGMLWGEQAAIATFNAQAEGQQTRERDPDPEPERERPG